jgi:integrase
MSQSNFLRPTARNSRPNALSPEHFLLLIDVATSWHDKSLWLLLAASGMRLIDALELRLEDVSLSEQEVNARSKLKGVMKFDVPRELESYLRGTIYLVPLLRQRLFHALERYINLEHIPNADPFRRYLFQKIDGRNSIQPLANATAAFSKALRAAGIPRRHDGKNYTLHSLRASFAAYTLNCCLGHRTIDVTGLYLPSPKTLGALIKLPNKRT